MLNERTVYTFKLKPRYPSSLAIKVCLKDKCLCFYDFNRGHMLEGSVIRHLKDGIIFRSKAFGMITFKPLTMQEFDERIRPTIDPHLSTLLHDLDDVYVWYRKLANMT